MTIEIRDQFAGIAPAISPKKLPEQAAQIATDVTFDGGRLQPVRGILDEATLPFNTSSIFYRNPVDGWMTFEGHRDYVRAFLPADQYGLTYFTDGTLPRFITDGSTAEYEAGMPRPDAPVANIVDAGDTSDSLLVRNQSYVVCWVDGFGRVGPTSLPGNVVTVGEGATVSIERPALPTGQFYSTGATWRAFRSNTGSAEVAQYQYVEDAALSSATINDPYEPGELTYVVFSDNWVGPPDDMIGLTHAPGDFLMGYNTNEVFASEMRVPHAWPYSWGFQEQVRGIAAIQGGILVVTDGAPWLLAGSSPQNMQKVRIESHAACVSARGLVDMGDMAIYPGKDGLYGASGTQVVKLTEGGFDEETWAVYEPETIIAFQYGDYYVGSYGDAAKGFMYNFREQKFVDLTDLDVIDAAFNPWDQTTHVIYPQGTNVIRGQFDAGELKTGVWRSRIILFPYRQSFSVFRVEADHYPVTVRIHNGHTWRTFFVENNRLRKITAGSKSKMWEFELEVNGKVDLFTMATATGELV